MIYSTLMQIPEFKQVPPSERKRTARKVFWLAFAHWQTIVGMIACGLCVVFARDLGGLLGDPTIGAVIGGGIGGFVLSQTLVYVARRYHSILIAAARRSLRAT